MEIVNEKINNDEVIINEEGIRIKSTNNDNCNHKHMNPSGGAFYGLGFIGAVIYFFSTASSFWIGLLGLLKAIVWPAILVFELLNFLKL